MTEHENVNKKYSSVRNEVYEWHLVQLRLPGVQGLHIEVIHAESDVSNGLPMFHMVGYLSSEVKEAAERVRTATVTVDFRFHLRKL